VYFFFAGETVLLLMSFLYHFNAEAADLLENLSLDSEPAKKVCVFAIASMHLKLWICGVITNS